MFYDAHYLFPRPWTQEQEAPGVPAPFPIALYGDNTITQRFVSGANNLSMVELWLKGSSYGWVDATLSDENGPLYSGRITFPENPKGGYARFTFPTIADAAGRTFWLTLAAPASTADEPAITQAIGGDKLGGALQLNEYGRPGNLDLRTYVSGTAVAAALREQLLPDLFRLRLQQYKAVKGEWFAILFGLMVGLTLLFLVLARPTGQRIRQTLGWTAVALLGGLLIWQIGSGRLLIPPLTRTIGMTAAEATATAPMGTAERVTHDLILALWTADRQPEERLIKAVIGSDPFYVNPAIIVPTASELGYVLDVPRNGRFTATFAAITDMGSKLAYRVLFNEQLLAEGTATSYTRFTPISVDLAPYAGQGGRLRLITEPVSGTPQGAWIQPQIVAQADWLLADLPPTAQPAGHQLGADVTLVGYTVAPDPAAEQVVVTLYWRAERPLHQNATVFVHLLDEAGNLLAQSDAQPVNNSYPLTVWPTGVIIADSHTLPLPDVPFTTAVGLYDPTDFTRWPVTHPDGTLDANGRVLLP
jgi:hypothetical protein